MALGTVFGKLFKLMLSPDNAPRHALIAFDLTQYVCERLQPNLSIAKGWLARLVDVLAVIPTPADRRQDVTAAILVLLTCGEDPDGPRTARARLLRLGYPLSGEAPSLERVQGFQSVLIQKLRFTEVWNEVQTVRTFLEQTAYLAALKSGRRSTEYGDLSKEAPEEWPTLQDALTSQDSCDRIIVLESWSIPMTE